MKSIAFLLLACFAYLAPSHAHHPNEWEDWGYYPHPKEIMISQSDLTFATIFDVDPVNGPPIGHVVKERFSLWTHYRYTSHENKNNVMADAYIRLVSPGQLFTWWSVIDVYNAKGNCIGTVEGCLMTFAPSKFVFKDGEGNRLATAYMDSNKMGFTVVCEKDDRTIAKYTRIPVPNAPDYWYLNIYEEEDIPPTLLVIFGAFAVDQQTHFKVDN